MDEPFGAVDPITRERLQNEFLRLQEQLDTTILLVTHDIDEAIKMGDRIAVFQPGGVLAQFDTPAAILEHPASDFVARFVGGDRSLKRLSLSRVRDLELDRRPTVTAGADTAEVRRVLDASGEPYVLMVDEQGRPAGWLWAKDLPRSGPAGPERATSPEPLLDPNSTLRDALSAMLGSAVQHGVVVDRDGRLLGSVSVEAIAATLREAVAAGT
jgi:osmoprotectant transport system ATP-binding protein